MSGIVFSGTKVLVVDDSQTIRRSTEMFLSRAGCKVYFAEDGFAALAQVVDVQPELILIDVMMPRLDGYQACALIKRNKTYSGIPIVVLSSKDSAFDRARGQSVGCDEYLTKPFTRDSLLEAVARHIKSSAAA